MTQDVLQTEPEMKIVSRWRVACDGGDGALGHPRVWLELNRESGRAECGYCDAVYMHTSRAPAGDTSQTG